MRAIGRARPLGARALGSARVARAGESVVSAAEEGVAPKMIFLKRDFQSVRNLLCLGRERNSRHAA
jgi:hypothetical protein